MQNIPKKKLQSWLTVPAILIFIFIPVTSFSSNIQLSTSVDKNQLTIEDSIELSIKISGVRNPPIPKLPPLTDFKVRSTGTQSSTQIFNSDMQVSTTHKYLLTPKIEGNFIIGPVTMNLSGSNYQSDPIMVTINKPNPIKPNENRSVYTETSISKKTPYINEQVVYTFKLFRKTEARNLNLSMPYDESFFRKENLGKAKRYSRVINGIAYDVDEVSIALFPIKIGESTIPPSIMELDLIHRTQTNRRRDPFARFFNDPFFGGVTQNKHKILSTKSIKLNTQPLPKKGKPNGFKNFVGQFSITATVGKESFDAGDTTTLTITVSGIGNVMDVSLTNLNLGDQFKIYPDQPIFTKSIHGNQIGGEKIFKFALVPFTTGRQTISSISLNYFDPDKKKYNTISTNPISLTIKPGTGTENLNLVQSGVAPTQQNGSTVSILARDILPIHTRVEDFKSVTFDKNQRIMYMTGILIPILIYLIAAGYIRYNHKMNEDKSYSRRQVAHRKAMKKLDQLSVSNPESKDFVRKLSQIIREYIGDKLNLQGTAFTSKEVGEKLNKNTFADDKIFAIKKLLEKFESMQYMPVVADKDHRLIDETAELLINLEK